MQISAHALLEHCWPRSGGTDQLQHQHYWSRRSCLHNWKQNRKSWKQKFYGCVSWLATAFDRLWSLEKQQYNCHTWNPINRSILDLQMNGQIKPKLNASYLFFPTTGVHVLVASGGGIYHLARSTTVILFCSTMYPTLEKEKHGWCIYQICSGMVRAETIGMPARRQARHKVEVLWANDWTSTLFDHKNMFGRVSLILNVRVCWGAL